MLVLLVALATCFYLPDKDTSSYVIIFQCFTDTGRHSDTVSQCIRISAFDATLNLINEDVNFSGYKCSEYVQCFVRFIAQRGDKILQFRSIKFLVSINLFHVKN